MSKILAILLLLAGTASAQTLSGDRVELLSGPCVISSGSGAPSGGATCDTYLDTATGNLYTKVSGTWTIIPRLASANTWTGANVFTQTLNTAAIASSSFIGGATVSAGTAPGSITSGDLSTARNTTNGAVFFGSNGLGYIEKNGTTAFNIVGAPLNVTSTSANTFAGAISGGVLTGTVSTGISAIKAVQSGTADVQIEWSRASGTAATWAAYIPTGSTNLRLYNAADRFTFAATGDFTATGGVTATTGTFTDAVSISKSAAVARALTISNTGSATTTFGNDFPVLSLQNPNTTANNYNAIEFNSHDSGGTIRLAGGIYGVYSGRTASSVDATIVLATRLTGGVETTRLTVSGTGTAVAGTLDSAGNFSVATNKLTVAASTGNADTAGYVGSNNYASLTTGWRCTFLGACDARSQSVDELRTKVFVADLEQVSRGSTLLTKSSGVVSQAFTCPAAAGTATLWVNDAPEALNTRLFASSDWVVLRSYSRTDGDTDGNLDLTIADCVGQVTSYADGTAGNDGQQSWTFTRGSGGSAGTMAGATVVAINNLAIDFGVSGNFAVEMNAYDGSEGVNAGYVQTKKFTTSPVSANFAVTARFGNVTGITGSTESGLVAGSYAASNGAFLRATDQNFDLHGITAKWWDSTTNVITIAPNSGSPYIGVGNPAPSTCCTTAGVFLGWDHAATKAKFSAYADANNFLTYDGVKLTWKAANSALDGSGNLTASSATLSGAITATSGAISGDFTIGSGGVLRSNATAFGTGTGYWLDYNAGTPRFRVGTTAGNRISWDGTDLTLVSANLTIGAAGVAIAEVTGGSKSVAKAYAFSGVTATNGLFSTSSTGSSTGMELSSTWSGASAAVASNLNISANNTPGTSGAQIAMNAAASSVANITLSVTGAGVIQSNADQVVLSGTTQVNHGADAFAYSQSNATLLSAVSSNAEAAGVVGSSTIANINFYLRSVAQRKATIQAIGGVGASNNGGRLLFFTKDDAASGTDVVQAGYVDFSTGGAGGGLVWGAPTGGSKGAGTINVVAAYDDNVLLTDWVYELYYDGAVQRRDATREPEHQPTRPHPKRLYTIEEVRTITETEHRLPWMPSAATFEDERGLGRMITSMWQGHEQQMIYQIEAAARIASQEARLVALEQEVARLRAGGKQ